eukprot:846446-Prymnesium_polylepis.1
MRPRDTRGVSLVPGGLSASCAQRCRTVGSAGRQAGRARFSSDLFTPRPRNHHLTKLQHCRLEVLDRGGINVSTFP